MLKQDMLQLKMTAVRVRMGIIEATHAAKTTPRRAGIPAAAFRQRMR